jgi:hypothetical protein
MGVKIAALAAIVQLILFLAGIRNIFGFNAVLGEQHVRQSTLRFSRLPTPPLANERQLKGGPQGCGTGGSLGSIQAADSHIVEQPRWRPPVQNLPSGTSRGKRSSHARVPESTVSSRQHCCRR